jgi:hypothetical protein
MCSWFTLENLTMYRGAILGFLGGSGAMLLAILEFRKPKEDRNKWVAWLELFVAVAFFGQSINDVWQVNLDAEEHKKSDAKFAAMSNNLVRATNELAQASNTTALLSESVTNLVESLGKSLTNFPSIQVIMEYIQEPKAQKVMLNMEFAFGFAGWKVLDHEQMTGMWHGIIIGYYEPPIIIEELKAGRFRQYEENPSAKAATALMILLNNRGVPTRIEHPAFRFSKPPENAIMVAIGERPSTKVARLWMLESKEEELRQKEQALSALLTTIVTDPAVAAKYRDRNIIREEDQLMKEERTAMDEEISLWRQINRADEY